MITVAGALGVASDLTIEILTIIGGTITGTAVLIGGAGSFLWGRISSLYDHIERNRRNTDDKIQSCLRKLTEINEAVSDLQNSLNIVWKRTQQVEQELKEALVMHS